MLFLDMCRCFFFKQKTADEMRISDWSSDVCSSDLLIILADQDLYTLPVALAAMSRQHVQDNELMMAGAVVTTLPVLILFLSLQRFYLSGLLDRKSVVEGKSVSVRVDLGGRRIITKKKR